MNCAYCGQRAVHNDHVLPRSLVKRYNRDRHRYGRPEIPSRWLVTVLSCGSCNWRKLTRRLVPPSWAGDVELLSAFFGGPKFQVWSGERVPEVQR